MAARDNDGSAFSKFPGHWKEMVFLEGAWQMEDAWQSQSSDQAPSFFLFCFVSFNSSTHMSIHIADLKNAENSLYEWGRGYRNSEEGGSRLS